MTREEAINEIKSWSIPSKNGREVLETLIPELRESKDERILKKLIEGFKNYIRDIRYFNDIDVLDILIFLEKQKEQKQDIEHIQQSWYMEGYKDREHNCEPKWIVNTGEGGPKYELNPKYGQPLVEEQKPVTFNEPYNPDEYEVVMEGNAISLKRKGQKPAEIDFEDWDTLGYIRDIVRKHVRRDEEFNVLDKWLTEHYVNQKPAEWSEEDEKHMNLILRVLNVRQGWDGAAGKTFNPYQNEIDWLKSLRPSWKPSEQEKSAVRTAISILIDRGCPKTAEQLQNILDAFDGKESRKDWKPSKEQMAVLERFLNYLDEIGSKDYEIMYSFLEQLDKL